MTTTADSCLTFTNRREAGHFLGETIRHYATRTNVLVLALPRGGVPVAYEVAKILHAPLDVFVVRKLGVPHQPELAMGAVASGGALVLDRNVIMWAGVPFETVDTIQRGAMQEVERQEAVFRGGRAPLQVFGKIVILVDDGLATGSTMRAAVQALRQRHPARIVVAVPVASRDSYEEIAHVADEVVCLRTPEPFLAVGQWYDDFVQTTDDEVMTLLNDVRVPPVRPGDDCC